MLDGYFRFPAGKSSVNVGGALEIFRKAKKIHLFSYKFPRFCDIIEKMEALYMYVHIGQDYMVPARSIVSIFDMDTATWSKHTRALIARLEHDGRVVNVFEDLPKAAVLCESELGEILYISQLSSAALQRRVESGRMGPGFYPG